MSKWVRIQGNKAFLTIFDGEEEREAAVGFEFEICPECHGSGGTSRHVECDGGGITSSEMAELCHEDEDFAEKYFGGFYDRPCDECRGHPGRVIAPNYQQLSAKDQELWAAQWQEERAYQRVCAAEQRMGA